MTDKRRAKRLRILETATTLFSQRGYQATRMQDIAAELGMQAGSLYYYFDSKEEALEEVCLYGLQQYTANMDAIAEGTGSFESRLFSVVSNHLGSYRSKNEALKVHNDERLYLPAKRRVRLKKLGSHYREQLESIIGDGIAAGAVRETIDSHFLAQSIIGVCNGLGELIVRDPEIDVFELARKCADLLLHGMVPGHDKGE